MKKYQASQYKGTANAKNDVAIVASETFASTALSNQFMGAVLLDDGGEILYDNLRHDVLPWLPPA